MKTGEENGGINGGKTHRIATDWMTRLADVEPWPEAVDGKALLDELAGVVGRMVMLPKWAAEAASLWIVHTYAFGLREVTTYLGIESPQPRCGKSTLLDVLGRLVKRPVRAANISPSALFRVIAEATPTLLIDEADTFLHSDELKGIFNSGYSWDGAFVMRVSSEWGEAEGERAGGSGEGAGRGEGNGGGFTSRLVNFSCWCPKAIARIGRLPPALADRCIVFVMQRKLPGEKCERLKGLDGLPLRRRCARFVQDHAEAIRAAQPETPKELNDRAADIWEPLLAVADLAGGDWPERARQAAVGLSLSAQEREPMSSLLLDILEFFLKSREERLFTQTIGRWLEGREDRPWMALKKGKGITGHWLGAQLNAYGVHSKTLRIGENRAKGYELADFEEAFRRYIPAAELRALKAELIEWMGKSPDQAQGEGATGGNGSGAANVSADGGKGAAG